MFHYVDEVGGTQTPAGEFTDGNPGQGVARTVLRASWTNMVQRELLNVVTGAGLEPAEDQFDQVLKAIQAMFTAQRAGRIEAGPFTTIPADALPLEGDLYNRADHPEAWAYIQAHYQIVTEAAWQSGNHGAFSSGNGSTTFRVPRLDDEVVRGAGSGRAVGSWQDFAMQNVVGKFGLVRDNIATITGPFRKINQRTQYIAGGQSDTNEIEFDLSLAAKTADETRMRNIAWRWIMWVK